MIRRCSQMFTKIDEYTYIFEGKVLLNDFYRVYNIEGDPFEDIRGESETLAGLILEVTGEIPHNGQEIKLHQFTFRIESADKRRISKIRVEKDKSDVKNPEV